MAKIVTESLPLKYETHVLKVSIHCEGCSRKVKKVLQSIEGVYETKVDSKQQKVTVTGNVTAETLLKKLEKTGKRAELWPTPTVEVGLGEEGKKQGKGKGKNKVENKQDTQTNAPLDTATASKDQTKADSNTNKSSKKICKKGEEEAKVRANLVAGSKDIEEVVSTVDEVSENSGDKEENKQENKPENKESGSGGATVGSGGGKGSKKKGKKGQNINLTNIPIPSEAAAGAQVLPKVVTSENASYGPFNISQGTKHQGPGTSPADHIDPQYPYSFGYQYLAAYGPPAQPYVMSYNTVYPNYGSAHYAQPPPYGYSYRQPEYYGARPDVQDPSYDLFNEENANACSIM